MPKEYIEREAFIEILKETKKDCEHYADKVCCDFAIRMVNLMPPADVQEVRHSKLGEKSRRYVLGKLFYKTELFYLWRFAYLS